MLLNFFDFEKIFMPIEDGEENIYLDLSEENAHNVRLAHEENRLWTRVEDDGEKHIVSGKQFVNRLDYIITQKPYTEETMVVYVEEEKIPKFKACITHIAKAWFIVEAKDKEEARRIVDSFCGMHTEIYQKSEAIDWEIDNQEKKIGRIRKL